jgi:septal ring factor EnvC (AmiA/AmiB activator)
MQAGHLRAEQSSKKELATLTKQLQDTERRAKALMKNATRQEHLLKHKDQQISDSKRRLQQLKVVSCHMHKVVGFVVRCACAARWIV